MPKHRIATIVAVSLVVLAGILAGARLRYAVNDQPPRASATAAAYSLTDQSGRPVTDAMYRGRWVLLFFGFTRCPDVCPMSMTYASDLLKSLGGFADKLQIVFVTVDPERDTPDALRDYLANFDPRIVGLTGTPEQIAAASKVFGVYYAKRALEGLNDYTMDHSTAFYLVNPEGELQRAFGLQGDGDELSGQIRKILSAPPSVEKE